MSEEETRSQIETDLENLNIVEIPQAQTKADEALKALRVLQDRKKRDEAWLGIKPEPKPKAEKPKIAFTGKKPKKREEEKKEVQNVPGQG